MIPEDKLFEQLDSQDLNRRNSACLALQSMGKQILNRCMLEAANGSDSRKFYACRILASSGGKEVKSFFIEKAINSDDLILRKYSLEGLKYMGIELIDMKALIPLFTDEAWDIRRITAEVITTMGESVTEEVKALLESDSKEYRYWGARILQEISGTDALKELRKLADDSSWFVRAHIAVALGENGNTNDIKLLEKLADDDNQFVSRYACEAIEAVRKRSKIYSEVSQ